MREVFTRAIADEYQEALASLDKMIRDPTVLRPGVKSMVIITPVNSGWEWNNTKQNIEAIEIWSDNNQISEISQERFPFYLISIPVVPT